MSDAPPPPRRSPRDYRPDLRPMLILVGLLVAVVLGWILIPRFQGRGYMQEAVGAVLAHCFTALNSHRIEAEVEPENVRSARLAQRLGFQREGLLRDRLFVGDRPRAQQMYGLLRSEWRA